MQVHKQMSSNLFKIEITNNQLTNYVCINI